MNELTVIENDLVPVYVTDAGEKVVYGTDLHRVLKVKSNYREWINRRLSDIDALENEDFQGVEVSTASGQSRKEHIIKLDAAKEMAMLERNEIGKQVRKYFIDVEKRHKQSPLHTQRHIPLVPAITLSQFSGLNPSSRYLCGLRGNSPMTKTEVKWRPYIF